MNAKAEVPAAVAMIAGILRDRAGATIAGTAPTSLPQAAPTPEPIQLPPKPVSALAPIDGVIGRQLVDS